MRASRTAKKAWLPSETASPRKNRTGKADADLFTGRGPLKLRLARGRDARKRVSRSQLAICKIEKRDPIELLEASNAGRVPELIPIRYGRMLDNPFAFYRGAASLMAFDLANLPHSNVTLQLSGDAHLANFGLFASPERRILFGLNDFDETLPGPFDWDLRRLAVSFVICARVHGFALGDQRRIVLRLCETFRQCIAEFSTMDTLDVWYHQFASANLLAMADTSRQKKKEAAVIDRARSHSSRSVLSHSAQWVKGKLRIVDAPPLVYHLPAKNQRELKRFDGMIRRFFADYRQTLPDDRRALFDRFELVDLAMRVVGVGSVGTRCYEALFMADGKTPLFLQLKEARASVLEGYLPASEYPNHGRRVVSGQRLLQSASDIFLGWSKMRATGTDFYVRQLRDMKGAFDFTKFDVDGLSEYAVACGTALAQSMAKAGDPAPINGYVGKSSAFDEAVLQFALAYAEQNEADWAALKAAVKTGRLQATRE